MSLDMLGDPVDKEGTGLGSSAALLSIISKFATNFNNTVEGKGTVGCGCVVPD